jgi:hypothetical protein
MRCSTARAAGLLLTATLTTLTGCATAAPPGGQHPPTRSAAAAPATTTARCAIANLHLAGGREGANETAVGFVQFTNRGPLPCALRGYPEVALLWHGRRLAVRDIRPLDLMLQAVVLAPGHAGAAQLVIDWGNWCGRPVRRLSVKISIPGTGTATVPFNGPPDYDISPQCVQPGQPSQLRVIQAYAAA